MVTILRLWPYAVGAIVLTAIVGLYFAWQNADAQAESLRVEISVLTAERDGWKKRTAALERAASERAVDTQIRTDETDKVSDALDRIEQKVKANDTTAPSDAALLAAGCSRMRRQGQTASTQYRATCGGR